MTRSADFPTTAGAFDTSFNSIFFTPDGFLSKLSLDGSALPWSTLLGGVLRDEPQALVADAAGRAYVAGLSGSVDFPTTAGAYDESYGGPSADETDAFVCRVSADGANLEWATLLGGADIEEARCLALAPGGDVLVGGRVVGIVIASRTDPLGYGQSHVIPASVARSVVGE